MSDRFSQFPLIVWLLCIYCVCVGTTLSWHALWLDEVTTERVIQYDWGPLINNRASAGHPPLFFMVEKLWCSVWGHSAFSLRAIPFLFGGLTLIVVYRLVSRLFSNSAAMGACLVFGFSPAQLCISQMARSYSLLQFLIVTNTWMIARSTRFRWQEMIVSCLLAGLATYTHGQAFLWLPVLVISILVCYPEKWRFAAAIGIGLASYYPFAVFYGETLRLASHAVLVPKISLNEYFVLPARLYMGSYLGDMHRWQQWVVAVVIFAPAVAYSLSKNSAGRAESDDCSRARRCNRGWSKPSGWRIRVCRSWLYVAVKRRLKTIASNHRQVLFLHLQFTVGLAAGIYAAATERIFVTIERYWVPVYPLVALSCGIGIHVIRQRLGKQLRYSRWLVVIGVMVISTSSFGVYLHRSPFKNNRAIANLLYQERRIGEEIIVCYRYQIWASMLWYYYPVGDSRTVDRNGSIPPPRTDSCWIVVQRDWDLDLDRSVARARLACEAYAMVVDREFRVERDVVLHCRRATTGK